MKPQDYQENCSNKRETEGHSEETIQSTAKQSRKLTFLMPEEMAQVGGGATCQYGYSAKAR